MGKSKKVELPKRTSKATQEKQAKAQEGRRKRTREPTDQEDGDQSIRQLAKRKCKDTKEKQAEAQGKNKKTREPTDQVHWDHSNRRQEVCHSDKLDKILNVCQVMENRLNRLEAHACFKSDGRKKKAEENRKDGDSSQKDAGHSEEQTPLNKHAAGEKGEEKLQEDPTTKKAEEKRNEGDSSLKDAGHSEEQPQQTTQDAGHQGDPSLKDAGQSEGQPQPTTHDAADLGEEKEGEDPTQVETNTNEGDPSLKDAGQSEGQPQPTTHDAADLGEEKEGEDPTQVQEDQEEYTIPTDEDPPMTSQEPTSSQINTSQEPTSSQINTSQEPTSSQINSSQEADPREVQEKELTAEEKREIDEKVRKWGVEFINIVGKPVYRKFPILLRTLDQILWANNHWEKVPKSDYPTYRLDPKLKKIFRTVCLLVHPDKVHKEHQYIANSVFSVLKQSYDAYSPKAV